MHITNYTVRVRTLAKALALFRRMAENDELVQDNSEPGVKYPPKIYAYLEGLYLDWKWYVIDAQLVDGKLDCLGYVEGFENEFGGFILDEIIERAGVKRFRVFTKGKPLDELIAS